MRRSAPRPLADGLDGLVASLAPATLQADVQRVWAAAVGSAIAREAAPAGERDGVVTVDCGAAVWAQELDMMAPELVARINAALGAERVRALRCRTRPG